MAAFGAEHTGTGELAQAVVQCLLRRLVLQIKQTKRLIRNHSDQAFVSVFFTTTTTSASTTCRQNCLPNVPVLGNRCIADCRFCCRRPIHGLLPGESFTSIRHSEAAFHPKMNVIIKPVFYHPIWFRVFLLVPFDPVLRKPLL